MSGPLCPLPNAVSDELVLVSSLRIALCDADIGFYSVLMTSED